MVAPHRHRAAIAFVTGWLSVFAWLFTTASACIFCAQVTLNIATLFHADYTPTPWQTYLVYVGFVVACTLITIFLPKQIPLLETVFFGASVTGFAVFLVAILASSPTKQPASAIFATWTNTTGWDDGTAFLLGVGQAMYTYLAVDSATHIAEEVPQPGRRVPKTMAMTVLIGLLTVLPWTLALLFSIQDFDAVAASPLPIMEVYRQALRDSNAGAAALTAWLLFIYFGACIACTVTTGRLMWAFARDRGLPFSSIFSRVHSSLETPANATLLTGIFCILYGLIYIGSTTAFNSFIATAILFLNVTYALPQGVAVFRGRSVTLPATRQFNLGPWCGWFCNVFAVVWVALFTVIFCFPVFRPVTVGSMNYVSVVIGGVCVFVAGLWWGGGKKSEFTGPDVGGIEGLEVVRTRDDGEGDVGRGQGVSDGKPEMMLAAGAKTGSMDGSST